MSSKSGSSFPTHGLDPIGQLFICYLNFFYLPCLVGKYTRIPNCTADRHEDYSTKYILNPGLRQRNLV